MTRFFLSIDTGDVTQGVKTMFELIITPTAKGYSPKAHWQHLTTRPDRYAFATKQEAKEWLRKTYGKAKRVPMYVDGKDGQAKKIGYVIGYRNADYSHAPVQHWLQQDWVEFRESNVVQP